jgi:hypothetical protein
MIKISVKVKDDKHLEMNGVYIEWNAIIFTVHGFSPPWMLQPNWGIGSVSAQLTHTFTDISNNPDELSECLCRMVSLPGCLQLVNFLWIYDVLLRFRILLSFACDVWWEIDETAWEAMTIQTTKITKIIGKNWLDAIFLVCSTWH